MVLGRQLGNQLETLVTDQQRKCELKLSFVAGLWAEWPTFSVGCVEQAGLPILSHILGGGVLKSLNKNILK